MKLKYSHWMILLFFCFSFLSVQAVYADNGDSSIKAGIQSEMQKQDTNSSVDNGNSVVDQTKIIADSKQVNPENLIKKARKQSATWIYYAVIFFVILLVVGIFVKPVLRFAGGYALSLFIGYFLLNYTNDVVSYMFYFMDKVESFVTSK